MKLNRGVLGVLFSIILAGLSWFAIAMVIAIRRKQTSLGKVIISTLLGLVPLALPAVLAMGFWKFLVALRPAYASFVDPWQPGWFRAAIVALVLAVVVGWFALCRRKIGSEVLSLGALFWLAALGIVLAVVAPGGSYVAATPRDDSRWVWVRSRATLSLAHPPGVVRSTHPTTASSRCSSTRCRPRGSI